VSDNIEITICLGSSCFARGNGENLRAIQEHIRRNGLNARLKMRGCLCREKCTVGPSLVIDGIEYTNVQSGTAVALLEHAMKEKQTV
jgi:NADH:ubiquinone oxidoreductase subunit E